MNILKFDVSYPFLLLSVITHSVHIILKLKSVIPFLKGEILLPYLHDSWEEENVLETEVMETDYLDYNLRN